MTCADLEIFSIGVGEGQQIILFALGGGCGGSMWEDMLFMIFSEF